MSREANLCYRNMKYITTLEECFLRRGPLRRVCFTWEALRLDRGKNLDKASCAAIAEGDPGVLEGNWLE